MISALEHFAPETVSDEKRDEMIEALAQKVVVRKLETPAIFFLEAHKPLSFLASQSLLMLSPLLGAFFGYSHIKLWSRILEDRDNVERLIKKIEIFAEQARQAEKNLRRTKS